jgi:hypothetical protein
MKATFTGCAVRYSANFIPRNAAVIGDVDDANESVGVWRPQPDFRIPERLSPGFDTFPDLELEAVYEDQGATFTAYQTAMARHAIRTNPDADLVMLYFEQPDGSGHQFTLMSPVVPRLGDSDAAVTSVYSVPNFYGAHGHDSELDSMSATFMAAGPDITERRRLRDVRNIDVAPTVLDIRDIEPAPTVDGKVISRALERGH